MKIIIILSLVFNITVAANAQQPPPLPPIGIIDFYGLRSVTAERARAALQIKVGDRLPSSKEAIETRLAALPNVAQASVSAVCCESGRMILYVGIQETGAPVSPFRAAPTGDVRLPAEIVKAGEEFSEAHERAILAGDAGEDTAAGHSLMNNRAARAAQEKFIPIANENLPLLRRALRESADARHRALAAEIIAYADDKRGIISDLVDAVSDPNETVRNNAMRALGLIAELGQSKPERKIRVPFAPFIERLNSIVWTDRNKSSLALFRLTEKRDKKLLAELKQKALPSLVEMARWTSAGHSTAPFVVLARVGGISDEEIQKSLNDARRRNILIDSILKKTR